MNKINYKIIALVTTCSLSVISRYFNKKPISKKNKTILDQYIKNNPDTSKLFKVKKIQNQHIYLFTKSFLNLSNYQIIRELNKNLKNHILFIKKINNNCFDNVIKSINYLEEIGFKYLIIFYNEKLFQNEIFLKKIYKLKNKVLIYGKKLSGFISFFVNEEQGIFNLLNLIQNKKEFQKVSYVGVDNNIESNNQHIYSLRLKAIKTWNETKNLKIDILLCKSNELEIANKKLNESLANEPNLIICGTHTIFQASINLRAYTINFSDIGNVTLNDNYANFLAKIFINYSLIGKKMALQINNDLHEDFELVPSVILKNKEQWNKN